MLVAPVNTNEPRRIGRSFGHGNLLTNVCKQVNRVLSSLNAKYEAGLNAQMIAKFRCLEIAGQLACQHQTHSLLTKTD